MGRPPFLPLIDRDGDRSRFTGWRDWCQRPVACGRIERDGWKLIVLFLHLRAVCGAAADRSGVTFFRQSYVAAERSRRISLTSFEDPKQFTCAHKMDRLGRWTAACAVFLLFVATPIMAPAQTFTLLKTFEGTNGDQPSSLIQGIDGHLYGTTVVGGNLSCVNLRIGCGTVFKLGSDGKVTTLYSFSPPAD